MKRILLLAALAALSAGCATHVRIQSEPAGAMIRYRGEGRAAFRWKTAPTTAPTEFDTRYGRISVYAVWPDGTKSEHVMVPLSSWQDPAPIVLRKPARP